MSDKILITGASDGIGFELLKLLVEDGNEVIGVGFRARANLPDDWPDEAIYVQADLTDDASCTALVKAVADAGWVCVDALVLNAGHGQVIPPDEETPANIDRTIDLNLTSPILFAHAFHDLLEASPKEACLVLIGSVARKGAANFASYAASKAGIHGFARALREEWAGKIDVLTIHPGPTATRMHQKAGLKEGMANRFFICPKYMAKKIRHIMKKRTSVSTVSFGARGIDLAKKYVGLGIR